MLYLLMLLYLEFGFRERGKGIKGGCEGSSERGGLWRVRLRFGEEIVRNLENFVCSCNFFFFWDESDEALLISSIQQNTV